MTYNEFMETPSKLCHKMKHKADEVAMKWEICTKIDPSLAERVQTSTENTSEKTRLAYIEAKKQLDRLMDEYDESKDQVTDFLYDNLDYKDADMLEWKYVNGKTLKETAEELGIAYQTARNRIGKAESRARRKFAEIGTQKYSKVQ